MTPMPHAVTVDQSVSDALARMHVLGVHHLPVISGDEVVGTLAERELSPIAEHGQADPASLAVGDVVARDSCLVVEGDAPLIAVVQHMADRGIDCCVVMEQGKLAGILTARDTMRLLVGALYDGGRHGVPGLRPSDVRARILSEHDVLRLIDATTEECARRVLDDDREAHARFASAAASCTRRCSGTSSSKTRSWRRRFTTPTRSVRCAPASCCANTGASARCCSML